MSDDSELLRRYTEDHAEEAFAELVRRHLGLVYHTALRQTGDPYRAEEVAQTVFTDLARKAKALTGHRSLAGWLYTSTRYAAAHSLRTDRRRQIREQEAHAMNDPLHPHTSVPETDWTRVRPVLDAVLHDLSERDREAVLLRFFERRPFSEIGAKLALTEDAARMRVERSLEKIRKLLARRGLTSTSAALTLVLTNQAGATIPVGLAAKITTTALAVHASTGLGIITFMTTGKMITGIAILALGGALIHQTSESQTARSALSASQQERVELLAKVRDLEHRLASATTNLRASEEDSSTLLKTLEGTAANQATTAVRVPITHDYVEARYKLAQELVKKGQPEEALKEFLWCFDEGMPPITGYGGVRGSYLLSMIAKLGETYPPALTALRERRDQAEQRLLASASDFDAAMDFSSINRYLKEHGRNLQLYDQLPADDPRKPALSYDVYDQLRTAQRYADAIKASPYKKMVSDFEDLTEDPPASVPNAAAIRQKLRTEAVTETAKDIEVLAGAGDLDHARALIDRILAFNNSAEAKAILQTHLMRAGHPELLTAAPLTP